MPEYNLSVMPASAAILLALCLLFYSMHSRLQRRRQRRIQSNIEQLSLLRALIVGLQQHRGLSNGVLCGDDSLRQDLAATRTQLDRHFQGVRATGDIENDTWHGLIDHWSRLRDSRTTDAANNLSQHHLIIRSTIFLMEDVASDVDLSQGRNELAYLPCIWQEVVQAAEWAGQARALGTGITAAGSSSAEQRVRMRFLYQKIQLLSSKAFTILRRHTAEHPRFSSFRLQQCENVVQELLRCIEQEILGKEQPDITAKAFFQQATQAIDELFALVDATLSQLTPDRDAGTIDTTAFIRDTG